MRRRASISSSLACTHSSKQNFLYQSLKKPRNFVQKAASKPSIYLDQWIAFGPAKATSNPVLLVFAGFTSQAFGINCCVSGYDAGSSLSGSMLISEASV